MRQTLQLGYPVGVHSHFLAAMTLNDLSPCLSNLVFGGSRGSAMSRDLEVAGRKEGGFSDRMGTCCCGIGRSGMNFEENAVIKGKPVRIAVTWSDARQ